MKVSVVIPLYNKARHIARALESVLGQTCQDFELIVVDDGSTDGGGEVVRQTADSRIRLVVQPNGGECAARNRGIQEAGSALVAFLDADDEWMPCFLETVIGLRCRFPDCGMYATAYCLCQNGARSQPEFRACPSSADGGVLNDYFEAALRSSPVTSSSVMIPKAVLELIGGFPVGIKRGGDLATWAQIALRYRVAWSPTNGAIYHLSADNRSCEILAAHQDVPGAPAIEEFLRAGCQTVAARSKVADYLAFMRLGLGKHHCLNGQKRLAFELWAKTRGTVVWARKRRELMYMVFVPSALLRAALELKSVFRTTHG